MPKWTPPFLAKPEEKLEELDVGKSASCSICPEDSLPINACEFAGALLEYSLGARSCSGADGTFCPKSSFSDPSIYSSCPTRLEKLKNRNDPP